jgi:ABC-type multidrug transport system ATPase subunit
VNGQDPRVGAANLSGPSLEVRWNGRRWEIPFGHTFVVGRDPSVELPIQDEQVSRRHLRLHLVGRRWALTDESRNGTFVNGQRTAHQLITEPVTVTLGVAAGAPRLQIGTLPEDGASPGAAATRSATQGKFSTVHRVSSGRIRIGRAADNDVVLSDLLVSRHHAELHRTADEWIIVDLDSANGTFVNGHRVSRTTRIESADVICAGHALLHLDGDRLVEYVDVGEVGFRASELVVRVPGGKILLDHVGFELEQRSLLAVVGPSGAGKSTLLRALTGFRPADEGVVEYADRDLYAHYDELRNRIGLVPQDDILHPQLTVRRALSYAAQLRFPADVSAAERDRRIEEVLAELALTDQRDQRISSLSGGQRKRTSVALELLTRPSLIFLDEPTSGLDPGLDKSVTRTLRQLADDGRTVVVVTHSVANLDVCDRLLLLAPGGKLAYFGPPRQALSYFGQHDFADLFLMLEQQRDVDWGTRFRQSPEAAQFLPPDRPRNAGSRARRPAPLQAVRQQSAVRQFAILCRRYAAVIAADRQYALFMAILPIVLSLLAHALPGATGLSMAAQLRGERGAPNSLLLVFVVSAALMGSAASIRELVKEREIYRRERAIGLSNTAYLMSKLAVLTLISGAQAVVLGLLGGLGRPAPDEAVLLGSSTAEIVVALIGVSVASMTVGLAVSAAIDNADRGMPLLVLMAMLQFILSSALLQIGESPVLGQLSWFVPARWGFALGASTIGLPSGPGTRTPYEIHDALWDHTAATWVFDLAALAGVTVVFAVLAWLLLRRLERRRRMPLPVAG